MDVGQMKNLRETFRDMTPDEMRKACPAATVKEGLTIRGSNQVERRLGTGVTVHHTEDDVVNWLNAVFAATAASATTGDALDFQTDTYHYSQTPIKNVVELLAGSGIDVRIRNYQ